MAYGGLGANLQYVSVMLLHRGGMSSYQRPSLPTGWMTPSSTQNPYAPKTRGKDKV